MEWTAYYENFVVRSEANTWTEIPDGIVVLVERLPGRRNFYKGDWYYIDNGEIGRVPPTSPGEPWGEKPVIDCVSCVKKGASVSDERFEEIYSNAWAQEQPL